MWDAAKRESVCVLNGWIVVRPSPPRRFELVEYVLQLLPREEVGRPVTGSAATTVASFTGELREMARFAAASPNLQRRRLRVFRCAAHARGMSRRGQWVSTWHSVLRRDGDSRSVSSIIKVVDGRSREPDGHGSDELWVGVFELSQNGSRRIPLKALEQSIWRTVMSGRRSKAALTCLTMSHPVRRRVVAVQASWTVRPCWPSSK